METETSQELMNCSWALFLHQKDEGEAEHIPLLWKSTFRSYKMSTPWSQPGFWWECHGGNPAIFGVRGEAGRPSVKPCPLVHSLAPWSCSMSLLWKVQAQASGCCCVVLTRRTHSAGSLPGHLLPPRHTKPFHLLLHKKRKEQRQGQALMILNGISIFYWHSLGLAPVFSSQP